MHKVARTHLDPIEDNVLDLRFGLIVRIGHALNVAHKSLPDQGDKVCVWHVGSRLSLCVQIGDEL
jgi:hypothetical protein